MSRYLWMALLVAGVRAAGAAEAPKKEEPVVVALTVTPDKAKVGDKVALKITVTNRSDADTALRFRNGQRYDIIASRDGAEVWRWSKGRFFIQALGFLRLKAGESRTFNTTWDLKDNDGKEVAPGTYSLSARITSLPELTAPAVELGVAEK